MPGGDKVIESAAKLGGERRAEAQAPAELRQKLAVADKAESDAKTALETAKNAPERAAAEAALAKAQADKAKVEAQLAGPLAQASLNLNAAQIKNINSEIGNRAAKLNLDRQTMQDLATLVMSVINSDLDSVIEATMALCSAETSLKFDRAFRRDAWSFMARFERGTIDSLDMAGLLEEFFALLRRYRIQCPADLVFLIKALSTIQGAAKEIDPKFDLISHGRPQLEKLIRDRYGFKAAQDRILTTAQRYLSLLEDMPDEVRDVLDQLRRREFSVNLRHHGIDRLNDDTLEHASGTIAIGLVIAGLMVGSSVLILAERNIEGYSILRGFGIAGIIIATVLAVTLPIRWIRRRK
jgi:hypothetical protein